MSATSFVVIVYAVWFVLSLATQRYAPLLRRQAYRFDLFRILPVWQLFRSPPLDTGLEWRDQFNDQKLSRWKPVSMAARSKWFTPLWNPNLTLAVHLYTFAVQVAGDVRFGSGPSAQAIEDHFAWRALWHYFAHLPQHPGTVGRQFRVMVSHNAGGGSPEVVYTSDIQPLPCGNPGERAQQPS